MGRLVLMIVLLFMSMTGVAWAQEGNLVDFVRGRTVYLIATGQTPTGIPMRSEATGFFVNDVGNILTVNHLLKGLGSDIEPDSIKIEAHIRSKNASAIPATVIDLNANRDLLVLDLDDEDAGKPLCANFDYAPSRLQDVLYTTGFPGNLPTVSQKGELLSSDGPNGSWVVSMPFAPGQSGSPVYNSLGEVIAIAKGQMKDDKGEPIAGSYIVIPLSDAKSLVSRWSDPQKCAYSNSIGEPSKPPMADVDAQVKRCVLSKTTGLVPKTFQNFRVVRAPLGKQNAMEICYNAPPKFSITGEVTVKIDIPSRILWSDISEVNYKNEDNRTTRACVVVNIMAETGNDSGTGSQGISLSGSMERVFSNEELASISEFCRLQITSAYITVAQ